MKRLRICAVQAAVVSAACLSFVSSADGQGGVRAIEVASIRPAAYPSDEYFRGFTMATGICGNGARGLPFSGSVVTLTRSSLCQLIGLAYGVQDFRVTGLPAAMLKVERTNYFDVRLKAEGEDALTADQARGLLKQLLADRFQLRLHAETKPIPVYELAAGKDGTKLVKAGSDANGVTMATYVTMISEYLDRPVVDQTGLGDERYNFRWDARELRRDLREGLPVPSIFREVEEQLGLSLKPATAPFEVLVVDHAEAPSAN